MLENLSKHTNGYLIFSYRAFFLNIEQLNLTIGNDIMFTGSTHSDLIAPCFQNSTHSEVIVQSKDLGVGSCRYIFDFLLLFLYQVLDWIFVNCTHVSIYPHVFIFTALQSLLLIRSVRLSWNSKQDAFFYSYSAWGCCQGFILLDFSVEHKIIIFVWLPQYFVKYVLHVTEWWKTIGTVEIVWSYLHYRLA